MDMKDILTDEDNGTLAGLRDLLKKHALEQGVNTSSGTATNMADGGMAPDLGMLMQSLNQTPATNYDFYKDVSAQDRANLYKKLTEQQHGPQQVIAQGLGGLGDAISNSFGGQNKTYQKDIMNNVQAMKEDQLGAMDTQRAQRMQDLQGNNAAMESDPNSPLSRSMAEIAKSQGINVPSGMPASVMLKVLGPLGDLAYKQTMGNLQKAQADEAARHNKVAEGLTASGQDIDTKEKGLKRRADAAEGLQKRPWYQKGIEVIPGMESEATHEMRAQLDDEEKPASSGGWKYLGAK